MSGTVRTNRGRKRKGAATLSAAQRAAANIEQSAGPSQASASVDPASFALIPTALAPKPARRQPGEPRLPKEARDAPVLRLPFGETYTQKHNLPPSAIPGRSAIQAAFSSSAGEHRPATHGFDDEDDNFLFPAQHWEPNALDRGPTVEVASSRHRRRRLQQHVNWNNLISNSLLRLYLDQKHGIRKVTVQRPSCECVQRVLNVTLAEWDCASTVRCLFS